MSYQFRRIGKNDWNDYPLGECPSPMVSGYEYRIKPEPAAPKWPQTTMSEAEIYAVYSNHPLAQNKCLYAVANAAIAHACETGQVIPQEKTLQYCDDSFEQGAKKSAISAIEATFEHMHLGRLDSETIQIILLKAAK